MRLPFAIRRQTSFLGYGPIWLPYIAVYQLTNRFPLFEPSVLPFTAVDKFVPFAPELLPIYLAYIPFFWWTVARSEDDAAATRIFYATHFQLLVAAAVWVACPVTMPRDLFYGSASYGWADAFWRWFDGPNNCLPSLHAANCLLFMQLNWRRSRRGLHTAASIAIIGSTLVVKQHYAVDLLAGAALYLATAALLARAKLGETVAEVAQIEKRRADGVPDRRTPRSDVDRRREAARAGPNEDAVRPCRWNRESPSQDRVSRNWK